ncbi:MAG: DNA recombination protein RmuC [Novosphingobium sp.]|uniref:DNA recombination protein RmuC n=1 Tax=Novosphingobium sp. TaxID=1874826 RepID=UPI003B9A6ED7
MDSNLILVIVALVIGIGVGWFLGSRPVAEWRARADQRDAEAKAHEGTVKAMTVDLAAMSERVKGLDALSAELSSIRRERDQLAPALAAARQSAADAETVRTELARIRDERDSFRTALERMKADAENFAEQKRLLIEAQEALRKEFENAGNKVLEKAQEAFLTRAQSRFEESEKTSAERLKSLLAPVDQRLRSYEEQVQSLEKQRVDAFGQLFGQIDALRIGQEAVRTEAMRLGNSLRNAPKARGRWGEQQLRNVLEQCGLSEHTDFVTEHSINTEDGRLRPDAIVRIPGNKQLVIDAKVSLNAYQDAFEADSDETRKVHLDQHAASMRNHIQTLGTKSYQSQFENAPDYVLMFVPGEHFIAAALEHDSNLWDFAFRNKVLLASPTNLVAIARTIAQVWQQEGLAKEAREIGKLASDLYDSLAKTQDDLMKTGVHLGRAVNSFNDFARTYEGNVLSRARRLTEKHIKIGKREINEEVPLVESAPRYADAEPAALASVANDEGDVAAE